MSDRPLRLRLHIQRNGLPDTRIVFLAATTENTTVMQLLEQVNETVPLESPDWGLDDYVVELPSSSASGSPSNRFECLHYQLVAKLFDKDDEVFIRPLSSEDLKKLRIGGRHQISLDGKRLVDGVPFGRPLLKLPRGRPPVAIAPRKRPRPFGNGLLEFEDNGEEDTDDDDDYGTQMVPYTAGPDDKDGSREDEEDYTVDDNDDEDEDEDEDDEGMDITEDELLLLRADARSSTSKWASKRPTKGVQFAISGEAAPQDSKQASVRDIDEDSDEDSDDDSNDGDFQSFGSDSDSDSDSASEPESVSDSGSSDDEGPTEMSSKNPDEAPAPAVAVVGTAAPNQGKTRTKKRNARRRAKRAMDKAREQEAAKVGVSDPAASTVPLTEPPMDPAVLDAAYALAQSPASFSRRLRLDMDTGRRLIASALGLRSSKKVPLADETKGQPAEQTKEQTAEKPLVNGTGEKEAPPPGHPNHWASRIDYTAVECCDENFVLEKPTFPFVQQWHSVKGQKKQQQQQQQQQQQKTTTAAQSGAKRKQEASVATDEPRPKKRAAPSSSSESSSDSSSDSSDSGGDDNDNSKSDSDDSSYNAADDESDSSSDDDDDDDDDDVNANESAVDGENAVPEDVDLPPLPANISSLPILEHGQAAEGMVITWKNWVLSEQTNWQPQVADVTARVASVMDDGKTLEVVLAQRDRELDSKPAKQYDEETGERVYGRFDGPDMEDDEAEETEDNGHRIVVLAELMEPRILEGV
ncbi:MAG: hypothetical protein STHCBS139747_005317 [Sporothrix thermara]